MQLTEEQEAEVRRKLGKVYGRGVVHMGKLEEVFGELIAERDRYRVNFTRALGVPAEEVPGEIRRLKAVAREAYIRSEIGDDE